MAITEYDKTPQNLYEHTNMGLDILHKYLPDSVGCEVGNTRKFKYSNEKTPSATLYQSKELNYWGVKDFSSGNFYNPIEIVMALTGYEFKDCLNNLYAEFNVPTENKSYINNISFREDKNLPADYFLLEPKKQIENAVAYSKFVTPELLKSFGITEIQFIERTTKSGKIMRIESTPQYPIFAYSDNLKVWAKTYYPKESNRTYKHGYIGKKPATYIHGLARIEKKIKPYKNRITELHSLLKTDVSATERKEMLNELEKLQLPYIIICSGGSDGVSVASLSDEFNPIWCNSEGEMIDLEMYKYLKSICKRLINLPDVDEAGVKYAYKYSSLYWKLDTVFISKRFLGEDGKDFRDYLKYFGNSNKEHIAREFRKLLAVPVNCNFITYNDRKQPRINPINMEYFLNCNNFFVYRDSISERSNNEDSGILVHIKGNIVSMPESSEIRAFCMDFLKAKGTNIECLSLVKNTTMLNANELRKIAPKALDFTKHGKDYQLFFFENTAVKVTEQGIELISNNKVENYVFENNIIQRPFQKLNKTFFVPYTDEKGNKRVHITENNCDFMNFLINGSRVYWEKEYLHQADKWGTYFILNSQHLTEEEQITQEQHFLGKCFAIGYMLHRYNLPDFAKFVYIVDDMIKDKNSDANGGTGKSLYVKAIQQLIKCFSIDGKRRKLFEDEHLYGTLKEEHDVIYFSDMHSYHSFENLFSVITDGISINPKNRDSKFLPFEKSPKIMGTFNYGLSSNSDADLRRILFVPFSSYYHYRNDTMGKEWQPKDDFHHRLFDDWDAIQWALFYNFMLRCVQFYIENMNVPYYSPTQNIEINNLKASIGDNFELWADDYFLEDKLNTYLNKNEVYNDCKRTLPLSSPRVFKQKMQDYCKLKGYVFNPKELQNYKDGRIMHKAYINTPDGQNRVTIEKLYLQTSEPKTETANTLPTEIEDTDLKDITKDIPF
jgi:hypothetical protein